MKDLLLKKTKKGVSCYLIDKKKVRISKATIITIRVHQHRERFRKFQTLSINNESISLNGQFKWFRHDLKNTLTEYGYGIQQGRLIEL